MRKLKKIFQDVTKKENRVLIVLILVGFFLRTFQLKQRFLFGHDQDLAGWIIKDIVVNKHLRLIGQETSTQGIFIGGLFYYLLIPFYLVFGLDSIGGTYLVSVLGLITILSFYHVFSKVFSKQVGLIAVFFYTLSFYAVNNDREVVPTMPVILWSVWFFYAVNLLFKNKQKTAYIIFGILIGLIWHLNFALVLVLPLIPIAFYLSRAKPDYKSILRGILILLIMSLPLILFEARHGFGQSQYFFKSITTNQHDVFVGYGKFIRVWHLMSKDIANFFVGNFSFMNFETFSFLVLIIFLFLVVKGRLKKNLALISIFWVVTYILFFSLYSKIVSEYYFNGTIVIWLMILSLFTNFLLSKNNFRYLGIIIICVFSVFQLYTFFSFKVNMSGYVQRKKVVEEISKDAGVRNYPCVAISYITNPGYNLGYRYLFWREGLFITHPDSQAPVYTIVFPLSDKFKIDKNFGAIGLIYPDYSKYNPDTIEVSCSGENSNLTDSMFGFTN